MNKLINKMIKIKLVLPNRSLLHSKENSAGEAIALFIKLISGSKIEHIYPIINMQSTGKRVRNIFLKFKRPLR